MTMYYFTYKLKPESDGGYQPKRNSGQTWLDIGYAPLPDGTYLGYSTKPIASSFVADQVSSDPITDYAITEITQAQAISRCTAAGYKNAQADGSGKIIGTLT